ncbi:Fe-dependent oxidoreductase [Anaeromyces robustus]|jgi:alcohol dehydrogenase YqhD (iron-dependent ADH family)|uniref:alcohol dehydrogenase n=1 Tax=Anaeromyces robustus TaxID=1754192 RepID=A0A1Y1XM30_9FUNG|nr:Fe-dependent oxidoreductase [Anaeromyces robustus]|eukprot:ORX86807.1 Fe-dependent oxidoreductase [Anaeromyces robustus]
MKFDFTFENPTKIYFGKNSLDNLEPELKNYGKKILLAYGGGSIKKNGIYDKVIAILKKCDKEVFECSGILPNPALSKMLEGAKMVKENNIDLILAVGGGSVVDCAKGIAVSAYAEGDAFQRYWINFEDINNKTVPVASVLTMVGTGSEMNGGSVISDTVNKVKAGRVFPSFVNPKFSILNPEFTFTVSKYQMVSGVFDIMSHCMEQYFSGDDDNTSDYLIEGILKSVIHSVKIAVQDPNNYEARSNIMWCATMALNKVVGCSKEQDWEVHAIEHQLSAYTNCSHGMGLCAISMPYYRYIYKYGLPKFVRFAKEIWNVDATGKSDDEVALEGIACMEKFAKECGMITTLKELGATKEMLPDIANSCLLGGGYKKVNHEEILEILKQCYE